MTSVPVRPVEDTRSAAQMAALVESSTQILCMLDLEGSIVWCNASMARVLGYDAHDLIGVNLRTLVHPDDHEQMQRAGEQLVTGAELSGLETRSRCRDGSWRALEWTVRADIERGFIYSAGRDVTERRDTDEILRQDEARLRAILDYSPSSIFVKDLQGRYLIVNRKWSRITGIPVADVVGATDAEIWPAEAASMAEREQKLLEAGVPQVSDERIHSRVGVRHFRISRFPLFDESGTAYAIGAIATDITARTEAENALAGRERLLATVLQASPDIITLLNADASIRQVSGADSGVLGGHFGDVAESDLVARMHPDDAPDVVAAFGRMVAGKAANVQVRFRVGHTDGHWVTLDTRGQVVSDETGAFAGAVIVSRDMTARMTSERRLRDAREAAEMASRTKSEFLSRMSHELRTPLNSILGFAQLLQMDELPEEQSEAVDHILRAGRHLLDLIDEVLDIARIESGHLDLMMTAVPATAVVTDAVELTRLMADDAGISVRITIDPETDIVLRADRQRLLQVLLNLLSNAVKYNRPGGEVDVSCYPSDPGRVRLVVTDTGQGISPADDARVFTPFDRLGAEQSGIEGTGVGLALSQHLVERMGGQIGFESIPGIGSTFFVELATATESPDDLPDAGSALGWSQAHAGAAMGGSFRVLLMEDDMANLDLVERVLSRRPGVELLAAMHGGHGIELAREHRPDLILVDLHLPDMPGTTVLDRLGEDPATASIPVAVVGSDAAAHEVRQLLGRGVVGFLTKPFDVRALLSLVDAVRSARVG